MREIDTSNALLRPMSDLDNILGHAFPALNKGFVRVIDYMGNDSAIVQAARVSYGTGTETARSDEGLIRYLMSHWHSTPFEMCELKVHVKLPVFVARQWIRHRTANVNEYSARYSILDREFYMPEPEQLMKQSVTNKQGRSEPLDPQKAAEIIAILKEDSENAYDNYIGMTDENGEYGLARELARMNLPTNIYTQWYWKVDLHNLFHFLRLRADSHAQYEIRVYANIICEIVRKWCPLAYQAFEDYRLNAKQFSASEMRAIHDIFNMNGINITEGDTDWLIEENNMKKREAIEFINKLRN